MAMVIKLQYSVLYRKFGNENKKAKMIVLPWHGFEPWIPEQSAVDIFRQFFDMTTVNNIKKLLNFHGIMLFQDNEVWKITKKTKKKSRLGYVCVDEKCSLLKKIVHIYSIWSVSKLLAFCKTLKAIAA